MIFCWASLLDHATPASLWERAVDTTPQRIVLLAEDECIGAKKKQKRILSILLAERVLVMSTFFLGPGTSGGARQSYSGLGTETRRRRWCSGTKKMRAGREEGSPRRLRQGQGRWSLVGLHEPPLSAVTRLPLPLPFEVPGLWAVVMRLSILSHSSASFSCPFPWLAWLPAEESHADFPPVEHFILRGVPRSSLLVCAFLYFLWPPSRHVHLLHHGVFLASFPAAGFAKQEHFMIS